MLNQAPNVKALPTLAVAFGAAIWGIYWLPLRYVEQLGMSGAWAVVIANVIPLCLLLLLSIRYRKAIQNDFGIILIIGFFSGSAIAFYSLGLVYTTVVKATLLFYLTPVWSTLIGMVFLNERVKWNRWSAIIVGMVGLYFVVGGGGDWDLNIGDWFGLASGLCWGIGGVLIKKHPQANVMGLVTSQHLFSLLFALLCCLLLPNVGELPDIKAWLDATPTILIYSWFGLVPSLIAIFWASGKLSPGRVGILMMTEVLVAVISAALLLDEQMSILEWMGVVLILGAGVLEVSSEGSEVSGLGSV